MCKGDSTFSKLMEMRGSGNFCLKSVQEFQEMGGGEEGVVFELRGLNSCTNYVLFFFVV